jgi:hypothetical protein
LIPAQISIRGDLLFFTPLTGHRFSIATVYALLQRRHQFLHRHRLGIATT